MRIVQAVHAFVPRSVAGVEVYTSRLARALRSQGHEVLILTAVHDLSAPPYSIRRRRAGDLDVAEIVSVHPRGTLEASYDDPELESAASQVLHEFRPDCVHVQHLLNLSAGIIPAARAAGAAIVITLHDYWLSCPRDGLRMRADLDVCETMDHARCAGCLADSPYLVPAVQRGAASLLRRAGLGAPLHRIHDLLPRTTESLLGLVRRVSPPASDLAAAMDRRAAHLRRVLDDVDLVLAPTAFARQRAIEFGLPAARVLECAYGVVEPPTLPRRPGPRRRVGYVGTLAPHKGVHVLVEAFRGVDGSDLRLDVHGSLAVQPGYAAALKHAASGDDRIRFRGAFPEGRQGESLADLDVLVVPSLWWENSPLVVLEALAHGILVVASATGGVPELIDAGRSGLLFEPGDVSALRRHLTDVTAGRQLAEGLPALPLKTVAEGAQELAAHYTRLASARSEVRHAV